MPPVDVAPIYADPWTQHHYEGMARLIEAVPDTADRTINEITCRHYCVRFFYTSVDRQRWVEISAIVTWQDYVDRFSPISCGDDYAATVQKYTILREEATSPDGTFTAMWVPPQALQVDEIILGMGFSYFIGASMDARSQAAAFLYVHNDADPTNPYATLAFLITDDIHAGFEIAYVALEEPYTIQPGDSFSFYVRVWAYQHEPYTDYVYLKAPFIRLERTF